MPLVPHLRIDVQPRYTLSVLAARAGRASGAIRKNDLTRLSYSAAKTASNCLINQNLGQTKPSRNRVTRSYSIGPTLLVARVAENIHSCAASPNWDANWIKPRDGAKRLH